MCLPSEVASLFVWVEVISESADATESVILFKVQEYMTLYLLLVMHKDDLYLHLCRKRKVLTTIFGYGNYFLIFRVAS